jgi:uncharacterized protein
MWRLLLWLHQTQPEAAMRRTLLAILAVAAFAPNAIASTGAAPLDCGRPTGRVERRVCADPALRDLHAVMREAYGYTEKRIRPRSDVPSLVVDQARWVERRNSCWMKSCIRAAYKQRIDTLTSYAVKRDD